MLIKAGFPPNYQDIKMILVPGARTVFTYGKTMYIQDNPPENITEELIAHEETHSRQQKNPREWWERYLVDTKFRLEQEIEAYHNQYVHFKDRHKWNKVDVLLNEIARDLSSPMYGGIISYDDARERIITSASV